MSNREVVVTGYGTINPIGNNISQTLDSLLNGTGGIGKISLFDATNFKSKIAGEVKDVDFSTVLDVKEMRRMSRFLKMAVYAANEAMLDSNLQITPEISSQVGVLIGTGIGGLPEIEQTSNILSTKGPGRISPFFIPMTIANMASGIISIRYKTKGYNVSVSSACATASHAIGDSYNLIKNGHQQVMITGGAEATICGLGIGGFAAMQALSTRNDDPKTASRPFDKDRDGFVMGEGCGILILENKEFALKRKANIICEVVGYGYSSDANHITAPTVQGPSLAMNKALDSAGMQPKDIDYINAHGTSTPLGDLNEIDAIKNVFGKNADKLSISSTKSMTGHLLGGAGAVEAIASILALQNSFIPPTINIFNQDPQCDLDVTPNKAIKKDIKTAMSNTFGFGGTNATLILKKVN